MIWVKDKLANEHYGATYEVQHLLALRGMLARTRAEMLLLLTVNSRNDREPSLGQEVLRDTENRISEIFSVLLQNGYGMTEKYLDNLVALEEIWSEFLAVRYKDVYPLILDGSRLEAREIAIGSQQARFETFMMLTDELVEKASNDIWHAWKLWEDTLTRTITLYVASVLTGLLFVSVLIYRFAKSICDRFDTILLRLTSFEKGERPVLANFVRTNDELGELEYKLVKFLVQIYEYQIQQSEYLSLLRSEIESNRKQRSAVVKSEEKFRALVETTIDWVWEVNADLVYSYSSPRVEDLLGYTPEEIIGKSPFDLLPLDEVSRVSKKLATAIENRQTILNYENKNLHKDGRVVLLESSCVPFFSSGGVFLGFRGVDRDITARKKAEEETAAIREQLLQSEKMASVGELAAGIAHEINNPVGYISSNLYSLTDDVAKIKEIFSIFGELAAAQQCSDQRRINRVLRKVDDIQNTRSLDSILKEMAEIVEESRDGLERIKSIVTGLKGFSHREADELVAYDVNKCIEDAIRLSWHEVKYAARLQKNLQQLPLVVCKPRQITQVFLNMLLNAVQSMEKGNIWIESSVSDDQREIFISVKDDGSGISQEALKRIFDPFFTTKPVGKGTGLGLSIAYGIISEHGGKIDVKSIKGSGTTFTIRLPVKNNLIDLKRQETEWEIR